jgi:hypothetical protein
VKHLKYCLNCWFSPKFDVSFLIKMAAEEEQAALAQNKRRHSAVDADEENGTFNTTHQPSPNRTNI